MCKLSNHTVETFCLCGTPWTTQRNSNYDMAQCCMYSEWYNKKCEKMSLTVFRENRKRGFAVDVKKEVLRKEYDYKGYTFRRT